MRTPDSSQTIEAQSSDMPEVSEDLFRREWGKIVATLTRIFGIERLALAECCPGGAGQGVANLALLRHSGESSAWIMRVARNLALDQARREVRFRRRDRRILRAFLRRSPCGAR